MALFSWTRSLMVKGQGQVIVHALVIRDVSITSISYDITTAFHDIAPFCTSNVRLSNYKVGLANLSLKSIDLLQFFGLILVYLKGTNCCDTFQVGSFSEFS